jgi:hypothetical protein
MKLKQTQRESRCRKASEEEEEGGDELEGEGGGCLN